MTSSRRPDEQMTSGGVVSSTSSAYLSSYFTSLLRSEAALQELRRQNISSLDSLFAASLDPSAHMPDGLLQTTKAIKNGSIQLVTNWGVIGPLWKAWKPLLADVFFYFDYDYEDGSGPRSSWNQARSHKVNMRLSDTDRAIIDTQLSILDASGIRRMELLRPLTEEPSLLYPSSRYMLSMSQFAYQTRKKIESILLDSPVPNGSSDDEEHDSDVSIARALQQTNSAPESSSSFATGLALKPPSLYVLPSSSVPETPGLSQPSSSSPAPQTPLPPPASPGVQGDILQVIVTLNAAIEVGGDTIRGSFPLPKAADGAPAFTTNPLQTGDLVVRFFGMKDNDGFFTRGMVTATAVRPTCLDHHRIGPLRPLAEAAKSTARLVGTASGISSGFKCHRGFWRVWSSIFRGCIAQHGMDPIDKIYRSLQQEGGRIILTGHSMGACLTCIAAYQLVFRYPHLAPSIYVLNYGAPLFARKGFNAWLEQILSNRIINICLIGDKTVSLPGLPFVGWYSPGPRLWISPSHIELEQESIHFQYWELIRALCLRF
ncbi:MAG: hypothetical protein Q8P67_22505 [archaeon]|nr:hypothetical protein [archaeon]